MSRASLAEQEPSVCVNQRLHELGRTSSSGLRFAVTDCDNLTCNLSLDKLSISEKRRSLPKPSDTDHRGTIMRDQKTLGIRTTTLDSSTRVQGVQDPTSPLSSAVRQSKERRWLTVINVSQRRHLHAPQEQLPLPAILSDFSIFS